MNTSRSAWTYQNESSARRNTTPSQLATKVGIQRDPKEPVNNRPDYIRAEIEGSLKRLGVDHVALYYLHRRDPAVPLSEAVGVMQELIQEGKIGGYGLSEVARCGLDKDM